MHTLRFVEVPHARKQGLEITILVVLHGAHALAGGKLEERGRAQRRPITKVEELLEAGPRQRPLVLLHLHIPELRLLEILRHHPHAFFGHDLLLLEEGFTLVEEGQRVALTIVVRELGPPMLRRPILMMATPGPWTATRCGGAGDGRVGYGLGIGLGRLLHQGDVLGEGVEGGFEIVSHGADARCGGRGR